MRAQGGPSPQQAVPCDCTPDSIDFTAASTCTPGVCSLTSSPIRGLILLYEIDQIGRFPEVGNFLSYSRLVRCQHESASKVKGTGGQKIGNGQLKWAFSEAACLMLRNCAPVQSWRQRQEKKRGKRKALSLLEAKLGRAVYHLGRKQVPFDPKRFLNRGTGSAVPRAASRRNTAVKPLLDSIPRDHRPRRAAGKKARRHR
jgi:hypothetical protein